MEKMQSMMSSMKPEDMAKWAGRAQTVSKFAQKPMALYRRRAISPAQLATPAARITALALAAGRSGL